MIIHDDAVGTFMAILTTFPAFGATVQVPAHLLNKILYRGDSSEKIKIQA